NKTEPSVNTALFLCLLKGDGNDLVIRQAVEMGVGEIYPVISARCVSRPDAKGSKGKVERWQKIANEAAGQCGRGILPQVHDVINLDECLKIGSQMDSALIFYEGGGIALSAIELPRSGSVGLLIGPEGGFDKGEVEKAKEAGFKVATLGPRILRAVTAPLAALGAVMLLTGNMD
ncbi:MAG: RNA methyltransferase, partial [Clostridia bacterium]|nr:RNA methyltransferase [Clostridia bacterium]